MWYSSGQQNNLERLAIEGDSPVHENFLETYWYPEYDGAREILSESAGTIR